MLQLICYYIEKEESSINAQLINVSIQSINPVFYQASISLLVNVN